jgi:hypothetical protein
MRTMRVVRTATTTAGCFNNNNRNNVKWGNRHTTWGVDLQQQRLTTGTICLMGNQTLLYGDEDLQQLDKLKGEQSLAYNESGENQESAAATRRQCSEMGGGAFYLNKNICQ